MNFILLDGIKVFLTIGVKMYDNIIFFGDKGYFGANNYEINTNDKITKGFRVKNLKKWLN